MTEAIHLTPYHENVKQWLTEQLPWITSIDYYPSHSDSERVTPCAFVTVMDWQRAKSQPMNGRLAVTLHGEILVVFATTEPQHQLAVRDAAMAIGFIVEGARFGMPIEPAVVTGAQPNAEIPELDGYAVWSVRFIQDIEVGTDAFAPGTVTPSIINVGYSPDIGKANEEKYEQVVFDE